MIAPHEHHPQAGPQHSFQLVNHRWNSNQEVANILYAASENRAWHSHEVRDLPQCGSQYIFARYDGNWFKTDSFEWKRRREGKLIREDHMKLKVNKLELISANYAHSAIVPSFHRRVYYLTNNPEYVLVHYLNAPEEGMTLGKCVDKIASSIRSNGLTISYDHLLAQLNAIYSTTFSEADVASMCEAVCTQLERDLEGGSADVTANQHAHQLERRNSCSSAFRRGLSSMALRRQPSTFSDSVDANYVGVVVNNCVAGPSSRGTLYGQQADSQSHSGETQRSSNVDDEMSMVHPHSLSARSASGGAASQASFEPHGNATEIVEIAPTSGVVRGGFRVLMVGEWYMKGHDYSVVFGDRRVAAQLVRPGVLSLVAPPAPCAGVVSIRVLCNDVIASHAGRFVYEDVERAGLRQAIVDRLHLLVAAFGAMDTVKSLPSFTADEESVLALLRALQCLRLVHPMLLSTIPSLPCRTILHLAAQLDYASIVQHVLSWRRSLPYSRELDPQARDSGGSTPLHVAAASGSVSVARVIVDMCPSSVDVLDDRGRTPCDVTSDDQMIGIAKRTGDNDQLLLDKGSDDVEHVTSTALWVMTNGETVTDEHLLNERDRRLRAANEDFGSSMSDCEMQGVDEQKPSGSMSRRVPTGVVPPLHVEISMDTDVHLPDSPKMADLFQAVTSPGVLVNENTRQKMASLARQIIDALPARIKNDASSLLEDDVLSGVTSGNVFSFPDQLSHMIGSSSQMHDDYWNNQSMTPYCLPSESDLSASVVAPMPSTSSYDSHLMPQPLGDSSLASSRANTFESSSFDFDKDLGEFFNIDVDGDVDPIQQRLGDLKLSDGEQREVYEAAMVIQRAYREYRERNTNRRQAEAERSAAVTIQSCYRRYKQFCYFKKLHSAAIVVQKHFRLKKVNQRECLSSGENDVQEHPTLEGQILRIQVPHNSSVLLREHRAATTIQVAYRGHRKRQAAARKIQKFMKESRMKLRRLAEQSGDDSSFLLATSSGHHKTTPPLDGPTSPINNNSNHHMTFPRATTVVTDGK